MIYLFFQKKQQKRHFYVARRGPKYRICFTITGIKFVIYVPIRRYGDFSTLQ